MGIIKRYESKMYGNYWKAIFKYGFLIGLGLSFVVLFRWLIIMPLSRPVEYPENIAMLVLIFLAVYVYKRNLEDKKITLKESYVVGLGVGVVASIIYGMFLYLYVSFIDSGLQTRYIEIQRAVEANSKLTDLEIQAMTTYSSIALSGIMLSSIMAVLWALIIALILRNEKAEVRMKKIK